MKSNNGNDSCITIIAQAISEMEVEQGKLYQLMRSTWPNSSDAPESQEPGCADLKAITSSQCLTGGLASEPRTPFSAVLPEHLIICSGRV